MKKKGANNTYFGNIKEGFSSVISGLAITLRHFWNARKKNTPKGIENDSYFEKEVGLVTLQYPFESLPIPDNGRYRLHNEIDDCIVCDLCAKICPVNCIEIEPVKSTEEIGKTSDGTTKRLYAAKFDIDMAKCCYCGLCTTVCPTECLTMTKTYDYSEYDIRNMVYHFSDLSPEDAESKKNEYEEKQRLKQEEKAAAAKAQVGSEGAKPVIGGPKPAFKPKITGAKPAVNPQESNKDDNNKGAGKGEGTVSSAPKPVIKPVMKKPEPTEDQATAAAKATPKPIIKPVIKKTGKGDAPTGDKGGAAGEKKAMPKPVIKPVVKNPESTENQSSGAAKASPKPIIKPVIKKTGEVDSSTGDKGGAAGEKKTTPKPVIKPVIKSPKNEGNGGTDNKEIEDEGAKKTPKPVIKPIIPKRKKDE